MPDFIVSNREAVARFFGTSASTIARWHQAGMPGRKGCWNLSEITQWRLSQIQNEAATVLVDDPEMSSGGSSLALERYRTARAAMAELDLRKMQENLVDRTIIESELGRCSGIVREKLEILSRQSQLTGTEAAKIVIEAFDELDAYLDERKEQEHGDESAAGREADHESPGNPREGHPRR